METEILATTKERYELNCKVVGVKLPHREEQSRGKTFNDTADVILLVPDESDQATKFYDAWLPFELENEDGKPACTEIGMEARYPVGGFIRGALFFASKLYPTRHIFLMSNRAEKILQKRIGQKLRVTVLGEEEFDESYEANAETKSPYSDMP